MFNLFKDVVKRKEYTIQDLDDNWNLTDYSLKEYVIRQEKYTYEQLWKLENEIMRLQRILIEAGIVEEADEADVNIGGIGYNIVPVTDEEEL